MMNSTWAGSIAYHSSHRSHAYHSRTAKFTAPSARDASNSAPFPRQDTEEMGILNLCQTLYTTARISKNTRNQRLPREYFAGFAPQRLSK
jgi:hypothetical protein